MLLLLQLQVQYYYCYKVLRTLSVLIVLQYPQRVIKLIYINYMTTLARGLNLLRQFRLRNIYETIDTYVSYPCLPMVCQRSNLKQILRFADIFFGLQAKVL